MGKIIKPNGGPAEKPVIDLLKARDTHAIIMTYLHHNFGKQVELCGCKGCQDVRNIIASD